MFSVKQALETTHIYSRWESNVVVGLVLLNVFTEEGIGAGSNFTICKRLRDLYNRITVSNVIFDSPIGPEVLTSSPEGKFQTQIRITFKFMRIFNYAKA